MAGVMAELRNVVQEKYTGGGASRRGFVPRISEKKKKCRRCNKRECGKKLLARAAGCGTRIISYPEIICAVLVCTWYLLSIREKRRTPEYVPGMVLSYL